ncbi:MAG: hypothetical protein LC772_04375 [Chloroflexi bacterium]|nr:hypothetical protein [Chloroflexota bacterium]
MLALARSRSLLPVEREEAQRPQPHRPAADSAIWKFSIGSNYWTSVILLAHLVLMVGVNWKMNDDNYLEHG